MKLTDIQKWPKDQAPALGAAAMREAALEAVEGWYDPDHPLCGEIRRIPTPTHADLLAEALKLPEVAALVDAAKGLEWALEQLAATRPHAAYLAMIDGGQADALLSLDARRTAARAALKGVGHE